MPLQAAGQIILYEAVCGVHLAGLKAHTLLELPVNIDQYKALHATLRVGNLPQVLSQHASHTQAEMVDRHSVAADHSTAGSEQHRWELHR